MFAPQLPFLFSVFPFHNKEVYGSEADSSSFVFEVWVAQGVFFEGRAMQFCLK